MRALSQRRFPASTSAATVVDAVESPKASELRPVAAAESGTTMLRIASCVIEDNGKVAKIYDLHHPGGSSGMNTEAGQFRVHLENRNVEPTLIHWHGLLPLHGQDRVPDWPQPLLPSGQSYDYDFALGTPGAHWTHAHTLQKQQLPAAPLVVTDPLKRVSTSSRSWCCSTISVSNHLKSCGHLTLITSTTW
jgi:FtsP/CotA-like multicopper oxidase with cupredoxin domain